MKQPLLKKKMKIFLKGNFLIVESWFHECFDFKDLEDKLLILLIKLVEIFTINEPL